MDSGWQDGKRASNPSSILPRASAVVVVRNKLRPVETDVKSMTTRCCGRELSKHNLKRKYSQNQKFSPQEVDWILLGSPPAFDMFPAGYPQVFAQSFEG